MDTSTSHCIWTKQEWTAAKKGICWAIFGGEICYPLRVMLQIAFYYIDLIMAIITCNFFKPLLKCHKITCFSWTITFLKII